MYEVYEHLPEKIPGVHPPVLHVVAETTQYKILIMNPTDKPITVYEHQNVGSFLLMPTYLLVDTGYQYTDGGCRKKIAVPTQAKQKLSEIRRELKKRRTKKIIKLKKIDNFRFSYVTAD